MIYFYIQMDPDFNPNLTPKECIQSGIFGGIYFNPRGGKPGIRSKHVDIDYREFPADWFEGLDEKDYRGLTYDKTRNKYGVVSGKNQAYWEEKGWINDIDPRGWFQWYCRYFLGRRSHDDARQIKRWQGVAGVRGRWKNNLIGKIIKRAEADNNNQDLSVYVDDYTISPKVRQLLLHWGVCITVNDLQSINPAKYK